ncbi:NADH-quinone oxidoreductase subunit J [Halorarius halobius]|uniref:NADH-quinone oxidoreductase subunit J n=1 Tax=Halorarius halobius TaxID=2962671 RepID=UPI0020CCDC59|nr:NADH-quinone oxidoreductase subunit J [Halorarius halobius]
MTTRPRLYRGGKLAGVVALALFGVLAAVFLTADFGEMAGFGGAEGITASIGYAMFNLDGGTLPAEGFLVAFEIIDVVLIAALAAAVMLARREQDATGFLPLIDGGRDTGPEGASRNDEDEHGGDD